MWTLLPFALTWHLQNHQQVLTHCRCMYNVGSCMCCIVQSSCNMVFACGMLQQGAVRSQMHFVLNLLPLLLLLLYMFKTVTFQLVTGGTAPRSLLLPTMTILGGFDLLWSNIINYQPDGAQASIFLLSDTHSLNMRRPYSDARNRSAWKAKTVIACTSLCKKSLLL